MFKALCKPESVWCIDPVSKDSSANWYIETEDSFTRWRRTPQSGTVEYLRNDDAGIDVFPFDIDGNKDFWFESELDAHFAAVRYYNEYFKTYPFFDDMLELIKDTNSNMFATSVESEIMHFI